MKLSIIIFATTVVVVGVTTAWIVGLRRTHHDIPAVDPVVVTPFACDMEALTPQLRRRHFDELGPMLRSLKRSVRQLPDGYEFEFPGDANTYSLLTEWSIQERACCPFFDINIRLDREGGPMWLRLTGREGTKEFVESEFGRWMR